MRSEALGNLAGYHLIVDRIAMLTRVLRQSHVGIVVLVTLGAGTA